MRTTILGQDGGDAVSLPALPPSEYPERLERLRALMRERGMAAVLLGTGPNLSYFSGYPSPAKGGSRPYFLVLPLSGEPVLIAQSGRRVEAARFSCIRDVRSYSELSRVPVAMIRDALRERGALGRAVGMEFGPELTFDAPLLEFRRLEDGLAGTRLADASDLLWRLRRVKSEPEIACLRAACGILKDAYAATFAAAREGMTDREIANLMFAHFDRAGGGDRFLHVVSGRGNYEMPNKPVGSRRVEKGDMVWFDAGCTVAGYWSDFSRGGVAGGPSTEQARAQEALHRITWEGVRMVRPGVRVSEIARFCNRKVRELPFPIVEDISGVASRAGHGVGLAITEYPHVSEQDDTVLEPGMVITVEPGVATEYGTFHVEENVVVRPDGVELLSEAPRELAAIGR